MLMTITLGVPRQGSEEPYPPQLPLPTLSLQRKPVTASAATAGLLLLKRPQHQRLIITECLRLLLRCSSPCLARAPPVLATWLLCPALATNPYDTALGWQQQGIPTIHCY